MNGTNGNTGRASVTTWEAGVTGSRSAERTLVSERALTITVNGSASYTIMRTPGHDRELTAGFLLTEGLINSISDISMLSQCVDSADAISVSTTCADDRSAARNLVINSSCGLCGRHDIDGLVASLGVLPAALKVNHSVLYDLPGNVRKQQPLFDATGATHAAAIFDGAGSIRVIMEDVGRHNAMDKAIGHLMLRAISPAESGIFLSGRTSLELIIKAARAGIQLIASVSAPTAAAVSVAERTGITVAGFVRGSSFTVYSHAGRIL